jgi:hypothetical protein
MSAPLSTSSISSRWSSAAFLPTSGCAPAPRPRVQLDVGVAHQQRLGIGVDRDELHTLEPNFDHAVDGVDAATADADDLDDRKVVVRRCHRAQPSLPGLADVDGPCGSREPHFDIRCRTREGEATLTLY